MRTIDILVILAAVAIVWPAVVTAVFVALDAVTSDRSDHDHD